MFDQPPPREAGAPLDWHVEFIAGLARLLRPEVYVELGIYHAELFNKVAPHVGQAIGVDVDPASAGYVRKASNVRFVCGTTDSFAAELGQLGLRIDLLFIDADHSRESVLQDFRNYAPFVRPHGLILLHDTHPGEVRLLEPEWCDDAFLAVGELQRDAAHYEMMTIPRSPGLTMCRKRMRQLSWMEPPAAESEDPAAPAPFDGASRYRIVCIAQVFNEIRKGNLERFFEHVAPLVDAVVVYDDGSTDGTYEYLLAHTPHVIRSARNDFTDEVHHKQILLEAALRLDPDFILSLDADEVFATEDPEDIQRLCAWVVARDLDGAELHEANLWRSHSWRRVDSSFDDGWFVRLWRVTPGMGFTAPKRGLHQPLFPSSIDQVERYGDASVLHYGFADWCNLAHKYLIYRAHGQRGYDMLDRLVSEEQLIVEHVPDADIPADLRRDDPRPAALSLPKSLEEVERRRGDVFRPGFSIVCLVYKSVEWLRFCYEQVLRYTDLSDKEFFFVANDASDEVLEYLRANYIPHVEWTNTAEQRTEWYVNNIYRAFNYGATEARGDFLLFINTDMGFSPGWFEALWDAYDGASAVASRLVESGKVRSGQYGVEMDFGSTPSDYCEQDFVDFAESIRESTVMDGGLHMPLLVRRDTFLSVGGFPEGNMLLGDDIFDPEMVMLRKPRPEDPCISGDSVMIQRLLTRRVHHRTACDSVVYHVQMGEMDTVAEGPVVAARPLVAVVNDPTGGATPGRILWDALRESLPLAMCADGLDHAADAAVVIQDVSAAAAVDPDRYTIAYLRDDLRAGGGDASHQERNLRAARFAVTDSLLTAMSYPEYEFEIIPAAGDDERSGAAAKWRMLLERAMQEVTVERIGFVGPQAVGEDGGAVRCERTPRRTGYAPVPAGLPLSVRIRAEDAVGVKLEEQAQGLRRSVERIVGRRFADPVLRIIHAVSWTVRPLRLRLARRQYVRSRR